MRIKYIIISMNSKSYSVGALLNDATDSFYTNTSFLIKTSQGFRFVGRNTDIAAVPFDQPLIIMESKSHWEYSIRDM